MMLLEFYGTRATTQKSILLKILQLFLSFEGWRSKGLAGTLKVWFCVCPKWTWISLPVLGLEVHKYSNLLLHEYCSQFDSIQNACRSFWLLFCSVSQPPQKALTVFAKFFCCRLAYVVLIYFIIFLQYALPKAFCCNFLLIMLSSL